MAFKHQNTFPLLHRVLVDGTIQPSQFFLVCETDEDVLVVERGLFDLIDLDLLTRVPDSVVINHLPTPVWNGAYKVIPYSHKINWALDRVDADAVVYLDNGSMPAPEKYEVMLAGMADHDAVYVRQRYTGFSNGVRGLDGPIGNPKGRLNFTQVMHTPGPERWTLDMKWADPDWADGIFFKDLAERTGPFHPVGDPDVDLDFHHMPSPAAEHLNP